MLMSNKSPTKLDIYVLTHRYALFDHVISNTDQVFLCFHPVSKKISRRHFFLFAQPERAKEREREKNCEKTYVIHMNQFEIFSK